MASEKITAIVESVKTMTVLELKELVDTICEEFGVSAVAAAAPAAAGAAAPARGYSLAFPFYSIQKGYINIIRNARPMQHGQIQRNVQRSEEVFVKVHKKTPCGVKPHGVESYLVS